MSTNHNRIKVSDLETNQRNKILTTNSTGELEFSDLNEIKIDSYNGLDYAQEGKSLDARQGKALKNLVDNKVDKVSGERLITAAEINKLSELSNITTTVKTIVSTVLATQNAAGFVTYINALNPVLVVGPNEIIKFTTSDTGRTFELNLRGRSFGIGQPAITTANVIETTEFLNKDLKLSNYPSTRNDGQSPTNKFLGTDANGNLKMYTIPSFPAPYLNTLIADSTLPLNTGKVILKGAFFTPTMTVTITGQTVNYTTFINDNEVHVNVTTGATEGSFDVTLNNGLTSLFPQKMLVVLGNVYNYSPSDFPSLTTAISSVDSNLIVSNVSVVNQAISSKEIDVTKNWRFSFYASVSPYYGNLINNQVPNTGVDAFMNLCFLDVTNNALQMRHVFVSNSTSYLEAGAYTPSNTFLFLSSAFPEFWNTHVIIEYRYNVSTRILSSYVNGVIKASATLTIPFTNNLKIRFRTKMLDIFNIKYVETA
ncbi:hypothetical protein [Flavobacterium sp. LC2016-01]|uniref:hypothetical protein n=1 Tax=Flavobacterium sp. LC2016-01 TaxID=2675876 RepID=UPI0012BAB09A|nr:hypothetical protein [Flavobacterium sp. LC2016-01]MTH18281.1 hypothetical protein [Flavobacterium sp. LC2016-01]